MGLDQYARLKDKDGNLVNPDFYYWRKHPDLQGWMENRWREKGCPVGEEGNPNKGNPMGEFNCVELELTMEDIERLEQDVKANHLPHTTGFFFGATQAEDKEATLEFIEMAKQALKDGYRVFYDSWW